MYKFRMSSTKSSFFPFESSAIPGDANIPSNYENHLKEEAFGKSLPGQRDALMNIGATRPVNLKIVPNSGTEVTRKEQVHTILICVLVASYTKVIILDGTPMPPHKQVFSVKSVKE